MSGYVGNVFRRHVEQPSAGLHEKGGVAVASGGQQPNGGGAPLHGRGVLPSRIVLQCYDDAGHATLDRTLSSDDGPTHHHDVNIEKLSVDAAGRVDKFNKKFSGTYGRAKKAEPAKA